MDAPKGPISADTWRTISRRTDEIEKICDKAEKNLHVSNDDIYREIDLCDEIVAWSALLGLLKMLCTWPKRSRDEYIRRSDDIIGSTENAMELME